MREDEEHSCKAPSISYANFKIVPPRPVSLNHIDKKGIIFFIND
jgi:hypothetical protein